jgi:hypothetical protein
LIERGGSRLSTDVPYGEVTLKDFVKASREIESSMALAFRRQSGGYGNNHATALAKR